MLPVGKLWLHNLLRSTHADMPAVSPRDSHFEFLRYFSCQWLHLVPRFRSADLFCFVFAHCGWIEWANESQIPNWIINSWRNGRNLIGFLERKVLYSDVIIPDVSAFVLKYLSQSQLSFKNQHLNEEKLCTLVVVNPFGEIESRANKRPQGGRPVY